jgi:hypothetical protein
MPRPFDLTLYKTCCGHTPRFRYAPDARIWWAECIKCGHVACALDGSADGLADAWNKAMETKEGEK